MSLGNNRDYKTTERRATRQLAKHTKLMDELMKAGMTREEASKTALKKMEGAR
jgi:hypothetical protein